MLTDCNVLNLLKAGDKKGFSAIYTQYWKKVYGFAALYISSPTVIQDVVQDVFIKLWEMREHIDEQQELDNLLFVITRNHIFRLSRLKINQEQLRITAIQALEREDAAHFIHDIDAAELKEHIQNIINQLPERRKEVFLMSRVENLSYAEIAERLSISIRAVERHIYLSLNVLKNRLRAIYDDKGDQLFLMLCF
jgi:RNA polymerase sigma-70 factor (ECF subfamily)